MMTAFIEGIVAAVAKEMAEAEAGTTPTAKTRMATVRFIVRYLSITL